MMRTERGIVSTMLGLVAAVSLISASFIHPALGQTSAPKTYVPIFAHSLSFPNNYWKYIDATLIVPQVPPAGTGTAPASYFLWLGVQPAANSANLNPIGNGVLQTVASFGPTCAPGQPSLGSPYRGWSTSPEYVNLNTTLTSYQGCRGGAFMDANPTDRLRMILWESGDDIPNRSLWRQRIERYDAAGQPLPCLTTAFGSGTPCTVYYELEMLGQEQRLAQLMIEYDGFADQNLFKTVTFENVRLVSNDSEPLFCGTLNSQGDRVQGSFGTTGVVGNTGCDGLVLTNRTTCFMRRCMYVASGERPPLPTPTGPTPTGITPTATPTGTDTPAPVATSWFDSLSTGAKAGFIIGMIAAGALILGLLGWLYYRARKGEKEAEVAKKELAEVKEEVAHSSDVKGNGAALNGNGNGAVIYDADGLQRPTPAMTYPYPMFYPAYGPEGGDANGRPASVYSASYAPYMAMAGNRASWAPRNSVYSVASKPRSTKSGKPDDGAPENNVIGDEANALAAAPAGSRLSFPASVATAPRPRSMFIPGAAPVTPDGRPLSAYDQYMPPVIMAAQQPVFVGPDGGYWVAGAQGMEKVNAPPGFYPAPPLVFVPAPWGPVEEEEEEESPEGATTAGAETKGKEPVAAAPPPTRPSLKSGGNNGGSNRNSRLSVQLPPEAGVVVPPKASTEVKVETKPDGVDGLATQAAETVKDASGQASEAVKETAEAVKEVAADATKEVAEALTEAGETVKDIAKEGSV